MIKNIIIMLVKMFKLEEVFLAEFKAKMVSSLKQKLASIENITKSVDISGRALDGVEKAVGRIPECVLGDHTSMIKAARNEFNLIESGMSAMKSSIENEIKELGQ